MEGGIREVTIYKDVKDVIWYEWQEIRHEFAPREIDLDATARAIMLYLSKRGTLARIRNEAEEWQRTETTHLATLDWFSMFEPITN